ncbi:MAG TPA: biosynthetic peptidoglycan transglycosylase, partial [Bdellovibrionota bacterium]|nr:biosynthetic peptidoglycan transglycosylase [Bdellovibrionota bacterium]
PPPEKLWEAFRDGDWSTFLKIAKERALYVVLSPWRFFKFLSFVVGSFVLVCGMGLGLYLWHFYRSLPDLEHSTFETVRDRARVRIKDRLEDKSKLYRWTPIQDISRDMIYAVVMSEDASFFEHDGINWDALANSLALNLKKRSYKYGASTISQQVVKNVFLTSEKSVMRKLKEIIVTQRLEDRFDKNAILELYLNLAEFGPDMFGIRAAAENFFHKTPAQLDAAEGAFLALMLPSPRRLYYSIFENRNLSPDKRKKLDRILRDMLHLEYISPVQYKKYIHKNFFAHAPRHPTPGIK